MVPDVKFNEAYISFIFTHPEWRRAGIAKFMLYHLIQVMGVFILIYFLIEKTIYNIVEYFNFLIKWRKIFEFFNHNHYGI